MAAVLSVALFFLLETSPIDAVKNTPKAGWCENHHRPRKAAQSGYDGYCKACYKKKHPKKYEAKVEKRKALCFYCGHARDLSAKGLCKPCSKARSCSQCFEVSLDTRAAFCLCCSKRRESLGAVQNVLASWCLSCSTVQQRESGLCHNCWAKRLEFSCHHCGRADESMDAPMRCAEASCPTRFHLCRVCLPMTLGISELLCKTCWFKHGVLCIFCGHVKAQHHVSFLRTCRRCWSSLFCVSCLSPPANSDVLPRCRSCSRLAFWCQQHCSDAQLVSGLCELHFKEYARNCQYCSATDSSDPTGDVLLWRPCDGEDCPREVHLCAGCQRRAQKNPILCGPCWTSAGGKCVKCRKTPAQTERKFMHCCKKCLSELDVDDQYALVQAESAAYFESIRTHQQWNGSEPALQILLLPAAAESPLPAYSAKPEFLDPSHCRLCLEPVRERSLSASALSFRPPHISSPADAVSIVT